MKYITPTKKWKGFLLFARSDLDRYRSELRELELTEAFVRGEHPIDVFMRTHGKYPLKEVNRVMLEWAKLTGVWLVEAPRGSYARWLSRMGLTSITPRALRRLVEALLTDARVADVARSYLKDQRSLNGQGEAKKKERATRKGARFEPAADESAEAQSA